LAGPSKESERNWIIFTLEEIIWAPTTAMVSPVIIAPWIIADKMNLLPQELVRFMVCIFLL
jgi:hypothetical protein